MVCALRNPGPSYERTRHNAGNWLLERLAAGKQMEFVRKDRLAAELAPAPGPGSLPLCRATLSMNNNGRMVAAVAAFFKIQPASLLIAHDEVDLPPGTARLKFGGGVAGHNGLNDVRAALGTDAFWRLRLGVGQPPEPGPDLVDYVLARPPAPELDEINKAIARILAVWPHIEAGDMDAAMRALHGPAVR